MMTKTQNNNEGMTSPAAGEVAELVAELFGLADYFAGEGYSSDWITQLRRAAELLQRQQPQPAFEQPPGMTGMTWEMAIKGLRDVLADESEYAIQRAWQRSRILDAVDLMEANLCRLDTPPQPEQAGGVITDGEIHQCLIDAGVDAMEGESDGTCRTYYEGWRDQVIAGIRRAIALDRSRQQPQPVPMLERPWERDGWCDEKGQCWWFNPGKPAMANPHIATSSWRLCRMLNGKPMGTHSLPHDAFPHP